MMQRQDIKHYTDAEIDAVISGAIEYATLPDTPEDLRVAVFTQAASMLSAKSVQIVQPSPVGFDLGQLTGKGRH